MLVNKAVDVRRVILTINGKDYEVDVGPAELLLDVLREKLGLIGTKVMCNKTGECGSCSVLIDGKPVLSCLTLAIECEGKDILTIEGLADPLTGELHPIQKAFVEYGGIQCGVCTPGLILTAKALLDNNHDPDEGEVREALVGHLCRCGNYKSIVKSVLSVGEN